MNDRNKIPDGAPVTPDGVKRNGDNYTLEDCYQHGVTHAAYNWAPSPWGHWAPVQVEAYNDGFNAKKGQK